LFLFLEREVNLLRGDGEIEDAHPARVGDGELIIDSSICVAVMHTRLRARASRIKPFCKPVIDA